MPGFIKKLRHGEEKFALPHTHLIHVLIVSFLQIPSIPTHLRGIFLGFYLPYGGVSAAG